MLPLMPKRMPRAVHVVESAPPELGSPLAMARPRNLVLVLVLLTTACSTTSSGAAPADAAPPTDAPSPPEAAADSGACSLAGTCLGAFFGTCFDRRGSCTDDAIVGATCFDSGAELVTEPDGGYKGESSSRATCFALAVSARDGDRALTYGIGSKTLTIVEKDGGAADITCPDGTTLHLAALDGDCATVLPPTKCNLGTCLQ
jgi:hypothetical protein